jgi:NAD-dependent deacetylase
MGKELGTDTNALAAELAGMLQEVESAVVLTGAGISVPSGIPDFRTPGEGIWEKVDPFEVATIQAFHADPKRFWEFYRPRFHMLGDKEPNPAHEALAELERRGLIEGVITQNIDRLHRKAGTRRLIEVHGSIETSSCTRCGSSWPLEEVEALFDGDGVASCTSCTGNVKPDVVLFGEMLPGEAIEEAQRLATEAELIICIGTSLEVHPVAALPELTLARGGRLAILTIGPTPYDGEATVRMDGDVVEDLDAVLLALG